MAPFSDPQMDQLMDRYFDSDCDPQFLYQGNQETIVKELKAWIIRRKEVYKEQMKLRDESQKSSKELLSGQVQASAKAAIVRAAVSRADRVTIIDDEANKDTARAVYLLDTLKSRGITWPELWWRPDSDGGVCSFLGTVDEAFDARATLAVLEDREEEERLQATRAEIASQFSAASGGGLGVGQGERGQRNKSRQEKRAEARTEAKAKGKEKDSKQTKG